MLHYLDAMILLGRVWVIVSDVELAIVASGNVHGVRIDACTQVLVSGTVHLRGGLVDECYDCRPDTGAAWCSAC